MNISIIGTGYVGLVTGTCLADFGLSVTCVDQDETKISLLNKESKVIFIAVGTPRQVPPSLRATEGSAAIPPSVIARSSSSVIPTPPSVIPAEAGIHLSSPSPSSRDSSSSPSSLREYSSSYPSSLRGEGRVRVKYPFDLVSNPEFLREGSAVYDFTHPDKIVIGCENDKAKQIMQEIYRKYFDPLAADALSLVSSDREYQHFAPTNLLLYEVACWGCENGYKTFHLGDGLDSKEDSLYKFKSAFNRNSDNTFSIGKADRYLMKRNMRSWSK